MANESILFITISILLTIFVFINVLDLLYIGFRREKKKVDSNCDDKDSDPCETDGYTNFLPWSWGWSLAIVIVGGVIINFLNNED